jgi:hypothetical protein
MLTTASPIGRALRYAGTHTLEDIELGVAEGRFQLWPGDESAIVTELLVTPLKKTLLFFLAGGNLVELRAMVPGILSWGRQQGCSHAALAGRFGWQRSFVREFGFQPVATVMETKL